MKGKEGITLIALIITIIVMLILVAVTINVALNGGLFDKAKTASEQTQRETDKEQLLSAVIGTLNNDGTVNEEELQAHLPDGFEYVSAKNVYKNTVTEKEYTIDIQTGKVTEYTGESRSNIEYYRAIASEMEFVVAMDYDNNLIKWYFGQAGSDLEHDENDDEVEFIKNNTTPFNVILNGEKTDIGTGSTKVIIEGELDGFITSNGKFFNDIDSYGEGEANENNEVDAGIIFELVTGSELTDLIGRLGN